MSYLSPIEIHDVTSERIDNYAQYIAGEVDRLVMREVHKVSCKVDAEELVKALRYDREQYQKGYEDGKRDAMPKRGEWYTELFDGDKKYQCSNCLTHWDVETRYCPFCGAKMEVQDGQ